VASRKPIPARLIRLARRQAGLVSAGQCDEAGVGASRRSELVARDEWRRVSRGVFDTGEVPGDLHAYDVDRLRSAWSALLANPRAIAVGACALMLHGVKGLPRRLVPEAALPKGTSRKARDGIVFRQYVRGTGVVEHEGRLVVALVDAFVQALPMLSREQAVACLDSALHQGLLRAEQLDVIRRRLRYRKGSLQVISWLPLVDGRAESPPESDARLHCLDAGIAPDDLQRDFFDARGRFVGRADMAWYLGDGRWLIVEIDSKEFHGTERQVQRDATRQNGLLGEGQNIILRFYPGHLKDHFTGEVAQVLMREGWQPGRELPPRQSRRRRPRN
jgi:hypothetical protein